MSIFARALSGAAQGVAQVTNKWIDEELTQQRAQFMADLQRTNAGNMRQDQAAFEDQRAPVLQEREVGRAKAIAATADDIEMGRLGNTELQGARRTRADEDADAEIQRKLKAGEALLPFEMKRAQQLADVEGRTRAKYREAPPDVMAKVAQIEKVLGRPLEEPEKLALMGLASKGRDPEMGYETVKETVMTADGQREVTRKVPIMAGAAQQGQSLDPIKAAMDAARAQKTKPVEPTTKMPAAAPREPSRGMFTDKDGNTQVLEPLSRLNELRKRLQQQSEGL